MKEFFDRNYYAVLDQLNGRPYGLMISAGTDGAAAVRQAERICTGWRLNAVAPPLIVKTGADTPEAIAAPKTIRPEDRALCATLGGTLAALLHCRRRNSGATTSTAALIMLSTFTIERAWGRARGGKDG